MHGGLKLAAFAVLLLLTGLIAEVMSAWRSATDEVPTSAPIGIVVVAGSREQATAEPWARPTENGIKARDMIEAGSVMPAPTPVMPSGAVPIRFRADDLVDPKRPDPTLYSDNQAWGDGWVRQDGVTEIDGVPIPTSPRLHAPEPDQPFTTR